MSEERILVVAEKESFIVRALIKKMRDSGINSEFVPWNISDINKAMDHTLLVTVYMGEGSRIQSDVLHFLTDKMSDEGALMMAVGSEDDIKFIESKVPKESLYKSYIRPLDNEAFVNTAKDLYDRLCAGEFRKSILIVDDDPSYLSLVREWLKGSYKVSMVTSGLQALKWLGKNKADLILLDHEMPVTTGPQVLEMLRSDEETKSIPVIFLTGKSDKKSVMEVVALKPEGYFLKTIMREELLENLRKFFLKGK
ncbi:MAG: response regulator [Lachnospiraceae bacterium]|nr:response regulator [Lachnospiraceae bacterium]